MIHAHPLRFPSPALYFLSAVSLLGVSACSGVEDDALGNSGASGGATSEFGASGGDGSTGSSSGATGGGAATSTGGDEGSSTGGVTASGGVGSGGDTASGGDASDGSGGDGSGGDQGAGADNWDNYAQEFFETYCVSCHNDDGSGEASRDYHDEATVVAEKLSIACGVASSDEIRTELGCTAAQPVTNQFPPGAGPKPDAAERDRLVEWVKSLP